MAATRALDDLEGRTRRLPAFACPICHAKNILFAMSRQARRQSRLVPCEDLEKSLKANFGIICPKCKTLLLLLEEDLQDSLFLKQNIRETLRRSDSSSRL